MSGDLTGLCLYMSPNSHMKSCVGMYSNPVSPLHCNDFINCLVSDSLSMSLPCRLPLQLKQRLVKNRHFFCASIFQNGQSLNVKIIISNFFYQLSWYIVGSLSVPVVVLGKVPKWVGWDKWQDKRWFIWVLWVLV